MGIKGRDWRTNLLPTYGKDKLRREMKGSWKMKGSWSFLETYFNVYAVVRLWTLPVVKLGHYLW
jgi:hypothetical protein